MWPALTIVLFVALVALHFWWRRRLRQAERSSRDGLGELEQQHRDALSRERAQAEALFDRMVEGFLLLDAAGRIQMSNRAFKELFGVTGEVRGRTVLEAVRLHELADIVARLTGEERVLGREFRVSGGATERFLEVNAAAVLTPSGERHGAILVFHDLTGLKRLERTRGEFVANVSHELRTPLSLIQGYVETLLNGAKDNPEVATRFLRTIDRNARRLGLLIQDLLSISELESGRLKLNLRPVALRPLVDQVFASLQERAAARGSSLVNELPDLSVQADPDRLEQVLANLADNAVRHGRASGTVTVGARAVPGAIVEVFVRDDGPGIPPEALERVFERFYRVDKARSREQGGTGLGLAIVKHLVQSHGGRAWATSELGHGATFYFTLAQA